jgi:hypothetical protein
MAEKIDDISINYEEDGILLVKELDKVVLSKGAWTTIMFKYQEWSKAKGEYGPIKYSIRRYQKRQDFYSQKSKFNISNNKQAIMIIEALQKWINEDE